MNDLEKEFNKDMIDIYKTAKKDIGYNATRFLQLVSNRGGLDAAKQLISSEHGTSGFTTLFENHRLDLSVEAHVIKPKYQSLFTADEIQLCNDRLREYGYDC